jgi:hypothetical protein
MPLGSVMLWLVSVVVDAAVVDPTSEIATTG